MSPHPISIRSARQPQPIPEPSPPATTTTDTGRSNAGPLPQRPHAQTIRPRQCFVSLGSHRQRPPFLVVLLLHGERRRWRGGACRQAIPQEQTQFRLTGDGGTSRSGCDQLPRSRRCHPKGGRCRGRRCRGSREQRRWRRRDDAQPSGPVVHADQRHGARPLGRGSRFQRDGSGQRWSGVRGGEGGQEGRACSRRWRPDHDGGVFFGQFEPLVYGRDSGEDDVAEPSSFAFLRVRTAKSWNTAQQTQTSTGQAQLNLRRTSIFSVPCLGQSRCRRPFTAARRKTFAATDRPIDCR